MNLQWYWILFSFLTIYSSYCQALVCFVCQNCPSPADWNGYTNNSCPGPCMKITTFIPTMGTYIYKACTTSCTEQTRAFGFSSFNVKCCNNTDRCNTGQRSQTSSQLLLLFMTLTTVTFSFLRFHRSITISLY